MADVFYDEIIADADELIKETGRKITVRHVPQGVIANADKPWDKSPSVPVDIDTFGAFVAYDRKEVDGNQIKATDKKLLFTATNITFELTDRDQIIDSLTSKPWAIIDVDLLQPGSTKVLYTVQVRKG